MAADWQELSGKAVSVAWTQNCLKLFRSFLRWR